MSAASCASVAALVVAALATGACTSGGGGGGSTASGSAGSAGSGGSGGSASASGSGGAGGDGDGGAGGAGGSTGGGVPARGAHIVLGPLPHPRGLAVRDGLVYFIASYGGLGDAVGAYDPSSGVLAILGEAGLDDVALAVESDKRMFVAGADGATPGNAGHISLSRPAFELTKLLDVPIAVTSMAIDDATKDLYVAGPSNTTGAKNILVVRAPGYAAAVVLAHDVHHARSLAFRNGTVFFDEDDGSPIRSFEPGGPTRMLGAAADGALALAPGALFFVSQETLGKVSLAPGASAEAFASLPAGVTDAAFDPTTGRIYALVGGTAAAHQHDGELIAIESTP